MSKHSIDTHDLIDARPRYPEELIDAARIVGRIAAQLEDVHADSAKKLWQAGLELFREGFELRGTRRQTAWTDTGSK